MKKKPIVKLVRAVSLKVGDEYFTYTGWHHRRVKRIERAKTKSRGMGVSIITFWPDDRRDGEVRYGSQARVYKVVGWRETKYHAPDNAVNVVNVVNAGAVEMTPHEAVELISQFCKTGKYAGIHPNTPVSQAYAKPLHERLQKEINELKSLLQDAQNSCGQYQRTVDSLREENSLKADAIDEQAHGIKKLNDTISGLRARLRDVSGVRDRLVDQNIRALDAISDIAQRLEDFRDGE